MSLVLGKTRSQGEAFSEDTNKLVEIKQAKWLSQTNIGHFNKDFGYFYKDFCWNLTVQIG